MPDETKPPVPQPADDEDTDHLPADDLAQQPAGAEDAGEPLSLEALQQRAAERDDLHEKWLRATADYVNLRQRTRKEVAGAASQGLQRLAEDLLPVLDDLERALEAANAAHDFEQFTHGVRLVQQSFRQALEKHGIEPIDAAGQTFDPTRHEAVIARPDPDAPDGTVVEEIRRGYRLGDRIIRASQVIVAKNPQPEPDDQPAEDEPED